jgi:hypothetical protein
MLQLLLLLVLLASSICKQWQAGGVGQRRAC